MSFLAFLLNIALRKKPRFWTAVSAKARCGFLAIVGYTFVSIEIWTGFEPKPKAMLREPIEVI